VFHLAQNKNNLLMYRLPGNYDFARSFCLCSITFIVAWARALACSLRTVAIICALLIEFMAPDVTRHCARDGNYKTCTQERKSDKEEYSGAWWSASAQAIVFVFIAFRNADDAIEIAI
jgi:hypothetical protein